MIPTHLNPLGVNEFVPLTLFALADSSSVTLNATGSPTVSGLQYRRRGEPWTAYTIGTTIQLDARQYVQFRNTADNLSTSGSDYVQFALVGEFNALGSIMSMLNNASACKAYCFTRLFYQQTALKRPPEMPAMTLASDCYASMYYYSGITVPPVLPALQMATRCYQSMMPGTAITAAPVLPSTALAPACYGYMLQNTHIPSIQLPATTLASYCYTGMLTGSWVESLTLPGTALADYCYQYLASNCSRLTSVEVDFTSWRNAADTTGWLSNVAASGTFTKPAALQVDSSSPIPAGWTVVDK